MESLLGLYESFIKISQSNPMLAGVIGVWFAGVTTWLLKDLPGRITAFIKGEFFTTLIIAERGESYDHMFNEKIQFNNFSSWVKNYELSTFSRVLGVSKFKNIWNIVPGLGLNLFIYNNRLFWYRKIEIQGSGQSYSGTKYQVNITTYGRTRKIFEKIFEEFKTSHEDELDEFEIRQIDGNSWWSIQPVPDKDLDNIFLNQKVRQELLDTFKQFDDQLERCKKLQTPHRLTLLLEGPTGTGKTTIIKALANYLKRHIYLMEPSNLLQTNLSRSLADWGKDGIIVIEDVDSLSSIKSRGDYIDKDHIPKPKQQYESIQVGKSSRSKLKKPSNNEVEAPALESVKKKSDDETILEMFGMTDILSGGLSRVLNNLDGIVEYHGSIIIMTTNDARSIDKAMLRPGRIDKIIHVGWLNKQTIIENIIKFYNDIPFVISHLEKRILIDSISGAKLSNLLKFSSSFDVFLDKLNNEGYINE